MKYATVKYTTELEVEKPVSDVFEHVIDLAKWWPEEFEGESLQLNTEFVLKTGGGHYSKNKVVEFALNQKVAWLTTESLRETDNFDWTGTKMIFELTPENNNTRIKFTYDGVVLENEENRLVHICDLTLKQLFYNSIMHG